MASSEARARTCSPSQELLGNHGSKTCDKKPDKRVARCQVDMANDGAGRPVSKRTERICFNARPRLGPRPASPRSLQDPESGWTESCVTKPVQTPGSQSCCALFRGYSGIRP